MEDYYRKIEQLEDTISNLENALYTDRMKETHRIDAVIEKVKIDSAIEHLALAMKVKMFKSSITKGRSGWDSETVPNQYLIEAMYHHVFKGDPVDIANFCMMLHYRKVPIEEIQKGIVDAQTKYEARD